VAVAEEALAERGLDLDLRREDPHRLGRFDWWAMGALLVVAFVLRFFSPIMPNFLSGQLWPPVTDCVHSTPINTKNQLGTLCGLAYPFQRNEAPLGQPPDPPNGQVFDEIYFATFAHDDLKGISYFDPEPPVAKEFIAAGEWLDGWFRATFQGARGDDADLGYNTFGWRLAVAVFGTLCIPLMYLLAFKLWPNRWFATAAAVIACCDGMFLVESRIGVIDVIPIFWVMLTYLLLLLHFQSRTPRRALVTLLLMGLAVSIGIAAKWIVLAAWASAIFFLVARPIARRVAIRVGHGNTAWSWLPAKGPALPAGTPLLPYLGTAVVALVLVPLAVYGASWFPFFLRGQFHSVGDIIAYNEQIWHYQATLKATHPYASAWWSWPFLIRPVAYYYEYQSLGIDPHTGQALVAGIVNLGNPIVWWASIPCLLSLPYFIFRHRSFPAAVIAVGYVTQYFPFAKVTRILFLYHYFGPLVFAILALAFVLARMQRAGPVRLQVGDERYALSTRWLVPAFLVLVVAFFVWFYPVWTALPISSQAYLSGFPLGKMWLRSWI
jgi:dolichyl-phosphate-mannose-protein mannosyltransferase